jgi:hypothetical protein
MKYLRQPRKQTVSPELARIIREQLRELANYTPQRQEIAKVSEILADTLVNN